MQTVINWYNAKEVHPAKNGNVLAITKIDSDSEVRCMMNVLYEDGYFNGKEHEIKNVLYWAYMPYAKDRDLNEEDF